MSPNAGGRGSQPMSTAVHRSPYKPWRSNSIYLTYGGRCDECEGIFNTEIELEYHKEAKGHWSSDDNDDEEDDEEDEDMRDEFVVYSEEVESTEEEMLL
jgi:hypothetical protein